jgi:hypothetical protein
MRRVIALGLLWLTATVLIAQTARRAQKAHPEIDAGVERATCHETADHPERILFYGRRGGNDRARLRSRRGQGIFRVKSAEGALTTDAVDAVSKERPEFKIAAGAEAKRAQK